VGGNEKFVHYQRYFELICFCGKFVARNDAQLRLSLPALQSFGCVSTPNLHCLVQVKMRVSTGKNKIVEEVMKNVVYRTPHYSSILPFLHGFLTSLNPDAVEFLAFLDSSRTLISELNPCGPTLSSLFWIPFPKFEEGAITGPNPSLLWKDVGSSCCLTVKELLSTESQSLKFQFLQFASQLLEAKYYKISEHQVQVRFAFTFF
jgi:hypothetical protein